MPVYRLLSGWKNTGWRHRQAAWDEKSLYLPGSFDYDEIRKQLKQLTDALGLPELTEDELRYEQESCEEALAKAKI